MDCELVTVFFGKLVNDPLLWVEARVLLKLGLFLEFIKYRVTCFGSLVFLK